MPGNEIYSPGEKRLKKAVQFGGGNIGRGFLGQLFTQSGYEVVFVEIKKRIIEALNRERKYRLEIVGDSPRTLIIGPVRGVDAGNVQEVVRECWDADIMATAVGKDYISHVAPLIAAIIRKRKEESVDIPLNVVICENLLNAGSILRNYIYQNLDEECQKYGDTHLGMVETVVSRMVPILSEEIRKENPLFVRVEEYGILPVDKKGFLGEVPRIKGFLFSENIKALEERKLYTHNAGHAIVAYLGYQRGYTYIWEALEDKWIENITRRSLEETGKALIEKHGFNPGEHQKHIEDLLHRFANRALGDTVFRVARDPLRKLSPLDRLVGSARFVQEFGIVPVNLSWGIAAALVYDHPRDEQARQLSRKLKEEGADKVLKEVCGIDPQEELGRLVKERMGKL